MPDRSTPLLAVAGLSKTFHPPGVGGKAAPVRAVRDVSFELGAGESLGIVGESGSGKTTVARMLVGLEAPSGGRIEVHGRERPARPRHADRRRAARAIQMVFQDPYTSLNPRQTVRQAIEEATTVHFGRAGRAAARADELLDAVGLGEREGRARPRALSGGQRQRAAIARVLALEPQAIVLDEAVSALDVSIQGQILNLLADMRRELGLAYILISHDLAVVRQLSDFVLVMYRGRIVEAGPVQSILAAPRHPYTQLLLDSVPRPGMPLARRSVAAERQDGGCPFAPRCPHRHRRCEAEPDPIPTGRGHAARCWLTTADGGA